MSLAKLAQDVQDLKQTTGEVVSILLDARAALLVGADRIDALIDGMTPVITPEQKQEAQQLAFAFMSHNVSE